MNIELGQLADGRLVMMTDGVFDYEIRRIEYYREQHLLLLVYDTPGQESELMPYELPESAVIAVEGCPHMTVIDHGLDRKLYGYDVPVVQVGAL